MKIGIISPNYFLDENANTICIQKIIDELNKKGNEIVYFAAKTKKKLLKEEILNGVKVYRFKCLCFRLKNYFLKLILILKVIYL